MKKKHIWVAAIALLLLGLSASYAYAETSPVAALTAWAVEQLKSLWLDFTEFMSDLLLDVTDVALSFWDAILYLIPAPDFIGQLSFCAALEAAGPWTAFLVSELRLGEALTMLTAALIFRLVRVFVTLFQWT